MRRKKIIVSDGRLVHDGNVVRIVQEINGDLFFEIGNEVTSDLSEAVAIMMRSKVNENTWNIKIDFKSYISPDKCLYWLSGGDKEWNVRKNYKKPWSEVYSDYVTEYGDEIQNIINKSNSLGDIRDEFIKQLNLPILYEYALSKGFV
jgi:hypothetical protein